MMAIPIIWCEEDKCIIADACFVECWKYLPHPPVQFVEGISKLESCASVGELDPSKLRMVCVLEGHVEEERFAFSCSEKHSDFNMYYACIVASISFLNESVVPTSLTCLWCWQPDMHVHGFWHHTLISERDRCYHIWSTTSSILTSLGLDKGGGSGDVGISEGEEVGRLLNNVSVLK